MQRARLANGVGFYQLSSVGNIEPRFDATAVVEPERCPEFASALAGLSVSSVGGNVPTLFQHPEVGGNAVLSEVRFVLANQELPGEASTRAASERIGILGGTFDPVHYAHLALAEEVYHALKLTRVLFVPAGQPPHKMGYQVTPVEQRVHMLEQAISGNPRFALSLVDVQRTGPSYTVDTLRLLREEWGPRAALYFIIGGDSLRDLPGWYDPAGVIAQATLVALMRPGYSGMERTGQELAARLPGIEQRLITLEGPRMEISSTDLRQRVAEKRPIKYQTPEVVEQYILRHGLYQRGADKDTPGQERGDTHATNAI